MWQRRRVWGAGPLQTEPTASISLPPLFCSSFHPNPLSHSLKKQRQQYSYLCLLDTQSQHISWCLQTTQGSHGRLCRTEQRASLPRKVVVFLHDLMFVLWNKASSNLKRKNDSPHKTIMQYFFTQNFHKVSISQGNAWVDTLSLVKLHHIKM